MSAAYHLVCAYADKMFVCGFHRTASVLERNDAVFHHTFKKIALRWYLETVPSVFLLGTKERHYFFV